MVWAGFKGKIRAAGARHEGRGAGGADERRRTWLIGGSASSPRRVPCRGFCFNTVEKSIAGRCER